MNLLPYYFKFLSGSFSSPGAAGAVPVPALSGARNRPRRRSAAVCAALAAQAPPLSPAEQMHGSNLLLLRLVACLASHFGMISGIPDGNKF